MNAKSVILILILSCSAALGLYACARKSSRQVAAAEPAKMIVCYFSATGTTADAAGRIARIAGAALHEIIPETRYSDDDLDWRDSLSRSYVEMHDRSFRPRIVDSIPDMADYDIVFIGYPNWWNTAPTVINTFIESNNLGGKTIVPFMTSGGSNITNSEKELREAYPDLKFAKGMLMNGVTDDEIEDWIENL